MRERPILFCADMVRAILDGRKTQTRRVVRLSKMSCSIKMDLPYAGRLTDGTWMWSDLHPEKWGSSFSQSYLSGGGIKCPYGQPGDHLWLRETWREAGSGQISSGHIPTEPVPVYYRADGGLCGPWRPSIHMPRWASRITLEITDVRVERVQEIGERDADAEGTTDHYMCDPPDLSKDDPDDTGTHRCDPIRDFSRAWDRINAGRGYEWNANPWVWVITFRRMEAGA